MTYDFINIKHDKYYSIKKILKDSLNLNISDFELLLYFDNNKKNLKKYNNIYILTSHPNYKMSEDITKKTINAIKSFDEKIILSSHCSVSTELQNMVDFFIYDKNNPLIKHDFFTQSWFTTDEYYALLNITKNENNLNHALGVFLNYYNSILLAKSLGYKTAVCTNFDMVFDIKDKYIIDNKIEEVMKDDKKAFFLNTPEREGIHYKTIFFITDIDFFIDTFKYVINEQEYNIEMNKVGSNTNCLENFFYHTLKNKKDDLILQEINENDLFKNSQINLLSLIEYNTILPIEGDNEHFIIWFSSANSLDSRELEFEVIKNKNIIYNNKYTIDKQFILYKKVKFNKDDIFEIKFKIFNDNEKLKDKIIIVNNDVFSDIKSYGNFIEKKQILDIIV